MSFGYETCRNRPTFASTTVRLQGFEIWSIEYAAGLETRVQRFIIQNDFEPL